MENTKQFQTVLLYTYCRYIYPKGRALMERYRVVPQAKRRIVKVNLTLED